MHTREEEKMIKTTKVYECKYFYDKEEGGKRELKQNKNCCNKFIYKENVVKCYVDIDKKYYNLVSVNDGTRWQHPIIFINNILREEK